MKRPNRLSRNLLVESPCKQTLLQHLVDSGFQFTLCETLGALENQTLQVTS